MKALRYASPAFYARKAATAVGVPPRAAALLGVGVAVASLDVVDIFSGEMFGTLGDVFGGVSDAAEAFEVPVVEHDVLYDDVTSGRDASGFEHGLPEDGFVDDYPAEVGEEEDGVEPESLQVETLEEEHLEKMFGYGCLAKAAYYDETDQVLEKMQEWAPELAERMGGSVQLITDEKPLIGNLVSTDTEVLVSVTNDGELIFAFRGTASGQDAATDIVFIPTPIRKMAGMAELDPSDHVKVHNGFLQSFNDVADSQQKLELNLQSVAHCLAADQGVEIDRITCCGHSLGGALATLAAYWCKKVGFPGVPVTCVTFGSPRVGNTAFFAEFEECVDEAFRFQHKSDVVPCVPPLGMFKHVGDPVLLCQPADDDYGLCGASAPEEVFETDDPEAYVAACADRPLWRAYLGISDHSMIPGYLLAMANILGRDPPEEDVESAAQEEASNLGLVSILGISVAGVAGVAAVVNNAGGAVAGGAGRKAGGSHGSAKPASGGQGRPRHPGVKLSSTAAAAGGLKASKESVRKVAQVMMPEKSGDLEDMKYAVGIRKKKVEFREILTGEKMPPGYRQACVADVIEHATKAFFALGVNGIDNARLKDGSLERLHIPAIFNVSIMELSTKHIDLDSTKAVTLAVPSRQNRSKLSKILARKMRSLLENDPNQRWMMTVDDQDAHRMYLLCSKQVSLPGYTLAKRVQVEGSRARVRDILERKYVALEDGQVRYSHLSGLKFEGQPAGPDVKEHLLVCDYYQEKRQLARAQLSNASAVLSSIERDSQQQWLAWKSAGSQLLSGYRLATACEVLASLASVKKCVNDLVSPEERNGDLKLQLMDGVLVVEETGAAYIQMVTHPHLQHRILISSRVKLTPEIEALAEAVGGYISGLESKRLWMLWCQNFSLVLMKGEPFELPGWRLATLAKVKEAQSSHSSGLTYLVLQLPNHEEYAQVVGGQVGLQPSLTKIGFVSNFLKGEKFGYRRGLTLVKGAYISEGQYPDLAFRLLVN